jgi:hypothetical protein
LTILSFQGVSLSPHTLTPFPHLSKIN